MESSERFEKLSGILEKNPGNHTIMYTQPDPDAMGSAYGTLILYQQIFENLEVHCNVDIVYCGEIAHPQNRWIESAYDLGSLMTPIKDVTEEYLRGRHITLVDSNSHKDVRLPFELPEPLIVIDHHRGVAVEETEDNMVWVEHIGAASTLVFELLEQLDVENIFNQDLADVLSLGIYLDTHSLMTATKRDHNAFYALREWRGDIHKASEYPLSPSYYEHYSRALRSKQRRDHMMVAGSGYVESAESGDDIAVICDELIRMEGLTLALVWGIVDSNIRFSARNTNKSTPLDKFLKARFGERSGAKISSAGKGEGGGLLPLSFALKGLDGEYSSTTICEMKDEEIGVIVRQVMENGPYCNIISGMLDPELGALVRDMPPVHINEIFKSLDDKLAATIVSTMGRKQVLSMVTTRMKLSVLGEEGKEA